MAAQSSFAQKFTDQVLGTIREHDMVAPGHRVLIGVSGGPDSMALVQVFMGLKKDLDIRIGLAHLNHMLRGGHALADETFVRDFAREHNLDLVVERKNVAEFAREQQLCVEEAGRNVRYDFFNRVACEKGFHRIALGHHQDDHIEQVLMNFVRGTGPLGLRGIPPVRQKKFIRPLIRMSRVDILTFLDEINQGYRIDGSNADTSYLRNRVRHCLIPFLEKEFNPDIKAGIERLSGIIEQEDDFLDRMARTALENATTSRQKEQIDISIPAINTLDRAIGARVIRAALLSVKQNLRRISHTHIRDILYFAGKKGESGKSLDLPGQIRVYRQQRNILRIKKEATALRTLGRHHKTRRHQNAKTDENPGI
ncbi:tRNA lysidine(34) synthetase TilS [Desulfobacter latus]|uniref:tRNA(Ile)-lysidine synthase n=1 Tax=Desulfobacter latus TaxID=2292 RepID=A0A850T653_9BACT|nr:tRNA lysidine(34) synthetase TilS [Desulfobacter latus]NWH03798.1 tRNA lysidine(34) synthetase TilS [Desulfobacter latus]